MIIGVGADILHLSRLRSLLSRHPCIAHERSRNRFARRILSEREWDIWLSLHEHAVMAEGGGHEGKVREDRAEIELRWLAVRWTAKEAAYKALYPHIRLGWKDVAVIKPEGSPKPSLLLRPLLMEIARTDLEGDDGGGGGEPDIGWRSSENENAKMARKLHLSVSHDGDYVVAHVVAEAVRQYRPRLADG